MYYIVYRTTNKVNGKIYVGVHKTNDLDDPYLGSGKILIYARSKYGDENFKREILFNYDNPNDMFLKEAEIVTPEFVAREDTYNLKVGGHGGFDYINSNGLTTEQTEKVNERKSSSMLETLKNRPELLKANVDRILLARKPFPKGNSLFKGRHHTDEAKAKIGEANSKHQSGQGNSQYGSFWITNEIESKKLSKGSEIPEGWRKGRIIKRITT